MLSPLVGPRADFPAPLPLGEGAVEHEEASPGAAQA